MHCCSPLLITTEMMMMTQRRWMTAVQAPRALTGTTPSPVRCFTRIRYSSLSRSRKTHHHSPFHYSVIYLFHRRPNLMSSLFRNRKYWSLLMMVIWRTGLRCIYFFPFGRRLHPNAFPCCLLDMFVFFRLGMERGRWDMCRRNTYSFRPLTRY